MEKNKIFKKFQSFQKLKISKTSSEKETLENIQKIFKENSNNLNKHFSMQHQKILNQALNDLFSNKGDKNNSQFSLKENSLAEINTMQGIEILKYLIHRYRYEIFPQKKILDDFPPLVQIEPSSICNFRCVFCFETDKNFTNKKNGFMGTMKVDLFKNIIDQIENKVEFVTLASRGEPLVSKEFEEMIKYTSEKFLNVKINTNASLLNEKKCHAILESKIKTLVFSADAADEKLYSELRVNGKLSTTLRNIKMFNSIKEKHYKKSKIITRVSGVKFKSDQNFNDMEKLWGDLVDQVAFVDYNPWENNYEKESNDIQQSCSDLWRRMFIWWDGKINPCDVDYKSNLKIGNISNLSISNAWNSTEYSMLRDKHLNKKRSELTPCRSCIQV